MNYQEENALSLLEFRAGNISLWEDQSLMLKAAAEIIYPKLVEANQEIESHFKNHTDHSYLYYPTAGLNQIWMLSVGYSTECLIKAIVVTTTAVPLVQNNKFNMKIFGNSSRSHDLYYLLDRINGLKLNLTSEQNSFLLKMSSYITWRGKYPVPKEPNDLVWYTSPDSQKMYVDLGAARLKGDKDKKNFEQIFDMLYIKLVEAKEAKLRSE